MLLPFLFIGIKVVKIFDFRECLINMMIQHLHFPRNLDKRQKMSRAN